MEIRKTAIQMLTDGFSQRKVALSLNCTHSTIQKLWRKFINTNSIENLPKSGRPVKTTIREQRLLTSMCKKDPHKTTRELQSEWNTENEVSISTTKRILRKYNLFGRRSARKPFLTNVHRKNRRLWCRNYRSWTLEDWKDAIFTDECQVLLHPLKKRLVRRPINARYKERYLTKTFKHGLKSIMIWGVIKSDGSRLLVKCPTKVDAATYREILKDYLFPFCQESEFLIQDNALIHKAKTTMKLIEDSGKQWALITQV